MISHIVTAHRALGKSFGSLISAMKEGIVICPIKVYDMLRKAFIPLTKPVPLVATTKTMGLPTSVPDVPPVL